MTQLEDLYLNKRIRVKVKARDNQGKLSKTEWDYVEGICTFVGPNAKLGWDLEVVVNRLPIEVAHVSHIELVEK